MITYSDFPLFKVPKYKIWTYLVELSRHSNGSKMCRLAKFTISEKITKCRPCTVWASATHSQLDRK